MNARWASNRKYIPSVLRYTLLVKIPSVCVFLTGWVIIDRCGKHFGSILNFIRDDFMPMPDSKAECLEVLAEAK